MQALSDEQRLSGKRLALVPTMGALHEGHLQLVRAARERADYVVVSIFVNPTQFGPNEDFARYPRTLDRDVEALVRENLADAVYAPSVEELYPGGAGEDNLTWVTVDRLDEHLCGAYRLNHFRGVTTVVTKLFIVCKPHVAVFGTKDAQQLQILKRMTRDLCFDIEIVGVQTVREPDGLALSSRNRYLNEEERSQAVVLSRAVGVAKSQIEGGELVPTAIVESMRRELGKAPLARVQYAEVVDVETLQPLEYIRPGQEVLAAVAVYFGNTRLIDNVFARSPER